MSEKIKQWYPVPDGNSDLTEMAGMKNLNKSMRATAIAPLCGKEILEMSCEDISSRRSRMRRDNVETLKPMITQS